MPNIEATPYRTSDERPFFLRLFSSDPVELVELPRTIEQIYTHKWGPESAGGRRVFDNGKEN